MTNGTNGTTDTKEDSLLVKLHNQWVAAGSKKVDAKEAKRLVQAYETAAKARKAAEDAFVKAQRAESDSVAAIVLARGKSRVTIGGVLCSPMSRGQTVYFRKENQDEVESFG